MRFRVLCLAAGLCSLVSSAFAQLTAADVQRVITQAVTRAAQISPNSVIAVTDREGYVIGVWVMRGGEPTPGELASAVAKAGTGAFLSSNANAFSSRTAGFIIQEHFPPGVRNRPPGPLVGVGFSNLPFTDVNRFKRTDFVPTSASPGTLGSPIAGTSLNGTPGGLPLYKNGRLVGGVGVTGDSTQEPLVFIGGYDRDEDVALAGQRGFRPAPEIEATNVFIDGISLPYEESGTNLPKSLTLRGNAAADFPIQDAPPPFPYPVATFGGVEGRIRQPIMDDPLAGDINGEPRLTAAEVTQIIAFAADRVRTTRGGIRLPVATRMEAFISVVNNPNNPAISPQVLGTFRTGDATIFSWDVAVQKARTALGFSTNRTAFSTRTVGFLAQTHYPPGIDPESPGPFFPLQPTFSGVLASELPRLVGNPAFAVDPRFPNGITIFPGGFPLYRNGQLIGAIGVSGDGIDQDDIVGASGTRDFLPPDRIRADQFGLEGTRLPYAKFPRDPEGFERITPVVLPAMAAFSLVPPALSNISARLLVGGGEKLMIGGFIISGSEPKRVVIRALGASLLEAGISNVLPDPVLELNDAAGNSLARADNWREIQEAELIASGLAPTNDSEAAIVQALAPGGYTASVTAQNGIGGVGLLEIYDVAPSSGSRLLNISSRGFVGTENDVMIAGFIVGGSGTSTRLVVRGVGLSLVDSGVAEALADPVLEVRDVNGMLLAANDNWRETQATELAATTLAPQNDFESAAVIIAAPGAYTATLQGNGGATGIGVLEIYKLD